MTQGNVNKKLVLSGGIWTVLEKLSANGVSFIVSIVLARLLLPEDYGVIALITVFIALAETFVSSGLGVALIQKKDAQSIDFSSVFYFNIVFSVILYVIIYFLAIMVANFYEIPILKLVLRVLGLSVIIGGINNVQQAYVSKTMTFKNFFYATFFGTILSGLLGIMLAFLKYGIWALVFQQLSYKIVSTIILWFMVKWRPTKEFSKTNLSELLSFGWKILTKSIIEILFNNLYTMIIGKKYSSNVVGYYNKGQSFPNFISTCVNTPLQKVLFPIFSRVQNEKGTLCKMYRKAVLSSSYVIVPLMLGLAGLGQELISIMLTKKWLPSVPYLQLWCISYIFMPVLIESQQVINALGHSDVLLKVEIKQKIMGLIIAFVSIPFGIVMMMLGYNLYIFIATIMNAKLIEKYIEYSVNSQFKDVLPIFLCSIVMTLIPWFLGQILTIPDIFSLLVKVVVMFLIYFLLSKVFMYDTFSYLVNCVKELVKKDR
jgi:teichuronic acid exporter